jgi:hypothetical protein
VLLFRPVTAAVHLVDVSWLFVGEGAVRLRRAKTLSEFGAALTSVKRAGLEKIIRRVRALVGAQDKPAKDCPTHAPERPLAVTPVQPTFWPLRTVGTDVIFSCLRCGAQVCESDLKAHERTVNHRAAASSIPRIQLRNVQVRTATNAGWLTARSFRTAGGRKSCAGEVVARNMVLEKQGAEPRYDVYYRDGFLDKDLTEKQLVIQRDEWCTGVQPVFEQWMTAARHAREAVAWARQSRLLDFRRREAACEAAAVPHSRTHDESLADINARWFSLPLVVTTERDVTDTDATGEAQPLVTPERPTLGRDDTDNDATGEAQPRSTVKRRRLAPQQPQRAPMAQRLHPVTVAGPRAVRFGVGRPEVQIVVKDLSLATRRCDLAARRDSRRRRLRARWQAEGGATDADWEEQERRSKQRAEKRAAQAARGVRGLEQLRVAMTSRNASAAAAPAGAAAAATGVTAAADAVASSGGSERKRQRV